MEERALARGMPQIAEAFSAERLADWLKAHVPDFRPPLRLERFTGGQSNPTFRLFAASGNYVLRSKPFGDVLPSAHAVDREFRVLKALANSDVPLPRVHALCQDISVIGAMFYVMDFVPGRVLWNPRLPELSQLERTAIFDSMNATIAQIHSLDPIDAGLGDYGRTGSYLERQVTRWTKQYRASQTEMNPAMECLIEWLPQHLPQAGPTRLVHGDYRLDNLIFHPTSPQVIAVLDWELSTLGDPIADFAYHAMTWRIAPDLFRGLAGVDLSAAGIPDERRYLELYLDRTGFPEPADWEYYLVLSLFRISSIIQGIAKRAIDGTAADAGAAVVGAKAKPLSELAWTIARGRSN